MKRLIYKLTLCLGMFLCLSLTGMAQDTLSCLDPDLLIKLDNAERQGRAQYIKSRNATKYTGTWVAETNGYVCRLEFTEDTLNLESLRSESFLGKYRLTKGDTVILDNIGLSGRPDFCFIGWERISGLEFFVRAEKLSNLYGNMQLLNPLAADSARINIYKSDVVWLLKPNQQLRARAKTGAALLKFFSPGIVFTKLKTHTE